MRTISSITVALFVAACGAATTALQTGGSTPTGTTGRGAAPATASADAAVVADFKSRVDGYLKVRDEALKDGPKLKETDDPAKITPIAEAMTKKIAAARMQAKPGDIFTPPVRTMFRRHLAPELKGEDGRDAKAMLKDDAPATVPFEVNARYPSGKPLPTMPANLLLTLPTLPAPLEYRIVDKHMILLDTEADMIVDYMANVIR